MICRNVCAVLKNFLVFFNSVFFFIERTTNDQISKVYDLYTYKHIYHAYISKSSFSRPQWHYAVFYICVVKHSVLSTQDNHNWFNVYFLS